MGCQSFFGSGTWAGADPAVTNTREVWCNTVLMGEWRVTQASQGNQPLCHSYGSLQKGAVLPLPWAFGTPDPTLFAGVCGEMVVGNVQSTTQQA